MISPVTGSKHVSIIRKIPVAEIIQLYRRDYLLDVSSYFSGINEIHVCQCDDSLYRFYFPENIFGDAKFYEALQQHDKYYSTWNWEHETATRFLKQGARLLEVGCGTGAFLEKISNRCKVTGIELNPAAAAVALKRGLNISTETIEQHANHLTEKYDVVCAFQVLEHIYEVKSFLESCLHCLKKGGLLIFGVPNNNPYLFRYDVMHTLNLPPHHAGLWSKTAFRNLEKYFPVTTEKILFDPLENISHYTHMHYAHWNETNSWRRMLPFRVPLNFFRMAKPFLHGRNILAVFTKVE